MTMGVKNRISSEYQRSFKSKYPCFTTAYERNVDYRIQRRSTEHFHQVEPFLWDSDSSENSSELGGCDQGNKVPRRIVTVPTHIHKHEKYNKAYRDHLKNLTAQLENNLRVTRDVSTVHVEDSPATVQHEQTQTEPTQQHFDQVVVTEEASDSEPEQEPVQVVTPVLQSSKHNEDAGKSSHHSRPSNPVHKKRVVKINHIPRSKHVPQPHPFSAPLGRPLKKAAKLDTESKAPFVPYGFKDQETSIANKKTYNIRASADIYPSALLAQKRRKAQISKQEEDTKSASLKDKKKRAYFNEFNEKVRRETAQWQTEYRSHYAGYDKEIYDRSLSARPSSRHRESSFLASTW